MVIRFKVHKSKHVPMSISNSSKTPLYRVELSGFIAITDQGFVCSYSYLAAYGSYFIAIRERESGYNLKIQGVFLRRDGLIRNPESKRKVVEILPD